MTTKAITQWNASAAREETEADDRVAVGRTGGKVGGGDSTIVTFSCSAPDPDPVATGPGGEHSHVTPALQEGARDCASISDVTE